MNLLYGVGKFFKRMFIIRKELKQVESTFCDEVTQFKKNANHTQRLTINHDLYWFTSNLENKNDSRPPG